jgi:hypothetical protein
MKYTTPQLETVGEAKDLIQLKNKPVGDFISSTKSHAEMPAAVEAND